MPSTNDRMDRERTQANQLANKIERILKNARVPEAVWQHNKLVRSGYSLSLNGSHIEVIYIMQSFEAEMHSQQVTRIAATLRNALGGRVKQLADKNRRSFVLVRMT